MLWHKREDRKKESLALHIETKTKRNQISKTNNDEKQGKEEHKNAMISIFSATSIRCTDIPINIYRLTVFLNIVRFVAKQIKSKQQQCCVCHFKCAPTKL